MYAKGVDRYLRRSSRDDPIQKIGFSTPLLYKYTYTCIYYSFSPLIFLDYFRLTGPRPLAHYRYSLGRWLAGYRKESFSISNPSTAREKIQRAECDGILSCYYYLLILVFQHFMLC